MSDAVLHATCLELLKLWRHIGMQHRPIVLVEVQDWHKLEDTLKLDVQFLSGLGHPMHAVDRLRFAFDKGEVMYYGVRLVRAPDFSRICDPLRPQKL